MHYGQLIVGRSPTTGARQPYHHFSTVSFQIANSVDFGCACTVCEAGRAAIEEGTKEVDDNLKQMQIRVSKIAEQNSYCMAAPMKCRTTHGVLKIYLLDVVYR